MHRTMKSAKSQSLMRRNSPMSYTFTFMDNATYGASDVNGALALLVTSGIADPFTDGVPYNASKLNDIIYAVSTAGVVPDTVSACKVTQDADETTVHIAAGTAFFSDGSRITFDVEGETLPYTEGVKQYVYLLAAPEENRNYPVCSTVEPSGDYVMLAEIAADGALTDKRTYAKGKLPGYQSNVGTMMQINDTLVLPQTGPSYSHDYGPVQYTIHLGINSYSYLIYDDQFTYSVYDIPTGKYHSFYWIDGKGWYHVDDQIRIQVQASADTDTRRAMVTIAQSGTDLVLTITGYNGVQRPGDTLTVPLKFTII